MTDKEKSQVRDFLLELMADGRFLTAEEMKKALNVLATLKEKARHPEDEFLLNAVNDPELDGVLVQLEDDIIFDGELDKRIAQRN